MKTVQLKLYSYQELSKEAQEKAHAKWNEYDNLPYLQEYLEEQLIDELAQHKSIEVEGMPKLYYSLTNSQGDGVMFEGDFIFRGLRVIVHHSGNYYHARSKNYTWENPITGDAAEPTTQTEMDFDNIYFHICSELEKQGYKYIKQEQSEETFIEICDANEYTFEANGKMRNI